MNVDNNDPHADVSSLGLKFVGTVHDKSWSWRDMLMLVLQITMVTKLITDAQLLDGVSRQVGQCCRGRHKSKAL